MAFMRAGTFPLIALTFVMLACSNCGIAQDFVRAASPPALLNSSPFSRVGIGVYAGLGGAGVDLVTPLAQKFNVRAGAEYSRYSTTFQDQGAEVSAQLRMQSGHASLDWLPFGGGFRLNPVLVFNDDNRARATALIPPAGTITLNGQDYVSSATDPLHGTGSIDFRKVSPGLTLGWGNLVPRNRSRFSFPIEAGFYYVGQPGLQPAALGCEPVDQDAGFQQSLAQFIARNNHNLSYATFLPIFRFGFGYSFPASRTR